MIGLRLLANRLAREPTRTILAAGIGVSVCCLAWSIWAILGRCGKALRVLTLVPISFAVLSQTVMI